MADTNYWGSNFGGGGGGIFDFSESLNFELTYTVVFPAFRAGVKIYQIVLKRSMAISVDSFAILLKYFNSSSGNLIIKIRILAS